MQGTDPRATVETFIRDHVKGMSTATWNELKPAAVADYVRNGCGTGLQSRVVVELGVTWDPQVFTMMDWTYEKSNGGVAGITPERGVLSVLLRHRATGKLHWRVAAHTPHHIEVAGRARVVGAITGQNARGKRHIALIASSAAAHARGGKVADLKPGPSGKRVTTLRTIHAAPVHGSGDLNVAWDAEKALPPSKRTAWFPLTVFTAAGLRIVMPRSRSNPKAYAGTHGSRAIDWGWTLGDLTVTDCWADPHGSSDHNPVEYDMRQ